MKKTIDMESKLTYLLEVIKNNAFIYAASGYLARKDFCEELGKHNIQELRKKINNLYCVNSDLNKLYF